MASTSRDANSTDARDLAAAKSSKTAPSGRDSKVSLVLRQGQSSGGQTTTSPLSGSGNQDAGATRISSEDVGDDQEQQRSWSVVKSVSET